MFGMCIKRNNDQSLDYSTENILNNLKINEQIEIEIFLDNQFLIILKKDFILEINNEQLDEYGLTSMMKEIEITEIDKIIEKYKVNIENELNLIKENSQQIKFLGVKQYRKK